MERARRLAPTIETSELEGGGQVRRPHLAGASEGDAVATVQGIDQAGFDSLKKMLGS